MTEEQDASSARIELVAAILLGIAAILTAWAAYNAALTDGDALKGYTQSTTTRAESNFFYNRGNQQYASDTATFLQYQLEVERGNDDVADVIRQNLFTPELAAAVDAWDALGDAPDAPATPLDPALYQLEDYAAAEELNAQADQQFTEAQTQDDAGDKFELAVVFFAVSLFMAGIASLFKVPRVRVGLLVVSAVLLVPGIIAIVQGHSMA
jgi:hypothetical protein